jgi:hypothetical protein
MKIVATALILTATLAVTADAQQLQTRECNASNIAFVAEAITKMPDSSKQKKTASDEIGLASEAMTQGKDDECKDHLLKATLQTK